MPLESSTATLEMDIEDAYIRARDDGSEDGADPDSIITNLATDIATAVDTYFLTALVSTDTTSDSGQSDSVAGTTTSDGSGSAVGFLS